MNVYHLSAIISYIRHGEKDVSGELTLEGIQQAIQTGLQKKHLGGNIYLKHSGVGRVQKTAQAISHFIQDTLDSATETDIAKKIESYVTGSDTDAGINHPEEVLDDLHYVYDSKTPSTYFKSWIPVDNQTATKRAQAYLDHKDSSPEPGSTPSPKELAQRSIRTLLSQIETSLSTSYQIKENYINTTHEPVLLSMLYYLIEDFSPSTKDFVQQIGGSVDFAQGFDINIYQNDKNDHIIYLDFREFLKPLDVKSMHKFTHE